MAETYLQRKFLTKIRSSKSATTSQILSQPPIKRWPTSSQLVDSQSSSRESAMSPGPCQLSSSMSASQLSTAAISPTASLSAESDQHAGEPSKRSRLRSATKAIFFFRRAGGLLTRPDSTQSDQQANFWTHQRPHKKLVRQQTTDSSTAPNQPQFIVPLTNALKLPLVCLIRSVDGELMREVFVHRYELGSYLIESLKVSFGISDCKYFGLKMARSPDDQDDLRNVWLDMDVAVCKQVSKLGINPTSDRQQSIDFYLRIKFYPPSLARIQEPFVRHYLWLQLRRDLRLGKLTSSMNNLTYLMACVLQYEFGDHSQDQLERVPQLQILPNQDLVEHHAIELWRDQLKGSLRHQSQMQFLRAAVILETYGFDYYPVRDHQRQRAYLLGFNYAGVKTIRNGRIAHHFRWQSISKISNERRMIIFHVSPNESSRRKQILGFKCLSNEDCQCLYLRLVEQKVFFTLDLAYFDKSMRRPSYLQEGVDFGCAPDFSSLATRRPESSMREPVQGQEPETVEAAHPEKEPEKEETSCTIGTTEKGNGRMWSRIGSSSGRLGDQLVQFVEQVASAPVVQPSLRHRGAVCSRLWHLSVLLLVARLLLGLVDMLSGWLVEWLSFSS